MPPSGGPKTESRGALELQFAPSRWVGDQNRTSVLSYASASGNIVQEYWAVVAGMFVLKSVSGNAIARSEAGETSARQFAIRLLADRTVSLEGADFDDLLGQAILAGDAGSITADGRLNLRGADFRGACLRGAMGRRLQMADADLSGCDLSEADFREARLPGARLSGANMAGARFDGADMRRVDMSPLKLAAGTRSLGNVRSKADIWEHRRAVVATGARFDGADMRRAVIADADLSGANLTGTSLAGARIGRSNLDDAVFGRTDMTGATVSKNSMVSATVHKCLTAKAAMRNNTYVAWPQVSALFRSKRDAVRRLADFVRNERDQIRMMPSEMRGDAIRSIAIQGAVMVAASYAARALYVGLAGSPLADGLIASGLVGVLTLHKELGGIVNDVVGPVLKSAVDETVSRASSAVAGFRIGGFRGALGALVATGHVADRLASGLEAHFGDRDHYAYVRPGLLVVVDDVAEINAFLRKMNAVGPDGCIPDGGLAIEREIGGHLPGNQAPWRVQVGADGVAVATWRHADGRLAKSVRYAPDGSPTESLDHAAGATAFTPVTEERSLALRRRRAILEEIKHAVVLAAADHDGETHAAHIADGGAVVIRWARGMVDAAEGSAVRLAEADGDGVAACCP